VEGKEDDDDEETIFFLSITLGEGRFVAVSSEGHEDRIFCRMGAHSQLLKSRVRDHPQYLSPSMLPLEEAAERQYSRPELLPDGSGHHVPKSFHRDCCENCLLRVCIRPAFVLALLFSSSLSSSSSASSVSF